MSKSIIFWLAVLLLFSGAAVVWSAYRLAQNRAVATTSGSAAELDKAPEGVDILKDFRLTERSGKKLSSEDLKGHVWIASFFFASCPGSCRSQNLEIMALQNKYAKDGVKFVSITCDPKNDTPAKLREYADSFKALPDSWYFLTGDIHYVSRIGAEIFSVHVAENVHMDRLMLVDKWGKVRGHFDWRNPLEVADLKKAIEELTAEEAPPENPTLYGQHTNVLPPGAELSDEGEEDEVEEEKEEVENAPADDAAEAEVEAAPSTN